MSALIPEEIVCLDGLQLDYEIAKIRFGARAVYEEGDTYVLIYPEVSTASRSTNTSPTMPIIRAPVIVYEPREWYTCGELLVEHKIQLSCSADGSTWSAHRNEILPVVVHASTPQVAILRLIILMYYFGDI